MPENLITLFLYLEKEQIIIDKKEFEFQVQSHPDYPSFLAIVDTLTFFNIDNGAIRLNASEIELLPVNFIAFLKDEMNNPQLYFIEKKANYYLYTKDNKTTNISKQEIEARWENIVLLVEKPEVELTKSGNKLTWVIPLSFLAIFLLVLFQFDDNLQTQLFFLFPTLGMMFSISALKDLFGTKNELINSFCNMTPSTSCTNIVNSTKWKIFKFVNFSDLSIIFFSSQFLGLLLSIFTGNIVGFFSIQKVLFFGATPILFLSLYYQKFVEKKWCPICLIIIGIIVMELGYVLFFQNTSFVILLQPIVIVSFVFVTVIVAWSLLKTLLTQLKELKEFQFRGKRFMKNYEIFKNNLLVSNQIENDLIQSQTILIGNTNARVKIIVVTSPFCSHCVEMNNIIEEILEKHKDKVCFDIRFNFNSEFGDEKSKRIHQQLVAIYYDLGQDAFFRALRSWFETKDEKKLDILMITEDNKLQINMILEKQFNWNQKNGMNYTPAIIINQFVFPKQYERNELIHFITELSDDECFSIKK